MLSVRRIESYRDADGKFGKIVELVEERPRPPIVYGGDIGVILEGTMQAVQQIIPFPMEKYITFPKIILFLTEEESESIGVDFKVNKNYEVLMKNQKIEFREVSG